MAIFFETNMISPDPLLHDLFSLVLERQLKIGSYCLPTHRRIAHRIYFIIPFNFKNRNFAIT